MSITLRRAARDRAGEQAAPWPWRPDRCHLVRLSPALTPTDPVIGDIYICPDVRATNARVASRASARGARPAGRARHAPRARLRSSRRRRARSVRDVAASGATRSVASCGGRPMTIVLVGMGHRVDRRADRDAALRRRTARCSRFTRRKRRRCRTRRSPSESGCTARCRWVACSPTSPRARRSRRRCTSTRCRSLLRAIVTAGAVAHRVHSRRRRRARDRVLERRDDVFATHAHGARLVGAVLSPAVALGAAIDRDAPRDHSARRRRTRQSARRRPSSSAKSSRPKPTSRRPRRS